MRFAIILILLNLLISIENNQETIALKASNGTFHVRFVNDPFEFTSIVETTSKKITRQKRSLIELYNMVSCATGCNPLVYKGYGCYCGFLGSGEPVDDIDRCCAQHDNCYWNSKCFTPLHYFVPYDWKCINGIPQCVNWNQRGYCPGDLCECDRKLAECLRKTSCPNTKVQCNSGWLW